MEKEILEKLRKLSREDFIKYVETLPMKKYFRLAYSFEVVMKILDFKVLIDKYKSELEWIGNKELVSSTDNFKPSESLNEFIILEISSFYTNAHNFIEMGDDLPQIPPYWKILKDFRDAIPGHRDKEENFKVISDWITAHQKVDDIGLNNIISDFKDYFKNLLIKFPNDVK
jgi:hypothetical protein